MTNSHNAAWANQSKTLAEVQRYGSNLEREVRNVLDWDGGRVAYDRQRGYNIQIDCIWPTLARPKSIASVTYSNPDTPGHSNENKLQLKLGELALLKNSYPDLSATLVLGGTRDAWLPYVVSAFEYFYDDVVFLWESTGIDRLTTLRADPANAPRKHDAFWTELRRSWQVRLSSAYTGAPPTGLVRYAIIDALKAEPTRKQPSEIRNEVARFCMQASDGAGGTEWGHYVRGNWNAIEMSRSYFNPVEAAVEISLRAAGFKYEGGVAKDVEVSSFLHELGMSNTKLSEDFILYSRKLNQPVYIQCKASGGGRGQHGKNIQNRTKEQVARGILYSASLGSDGKLQFGEIPAHWISVLDGNWGVTKTEPLKYIHMLQLAGYDNFFAASSLLDEELDVAKINNPLIEYLESLDCE